MDLHKAIRAIHNSVTTINGSSQNDIVATDINENEVSINWTLVNAWTDPEQYKFDTVEQELKDAEQAAIDKKASAKTKLKALGLDDAELKTLGL